MSSNARYTPFHPKWYRRPVSVWWWLESWPYTRFVLRELTSLPVAWVSILTLWQVYAITQGAEAYRRFLDLVAHPLFILVSVLSLGAVLFHALTWFHLAPKAMVVRFAGKRVPDRWIVAMNYVAWVFLTAAVAFFWLRR
jgi:fumarate reductase subunit C